MQQLQQKHCRCHFRCSCTAGCSSFLCSEHSEDFFLCTHLVVVAHSTAPSQQLGTPSSFYTPFLWVPPVVHPSFPVTLPNGLTANTSESPNNSQQIANKVSAPGQSRRYSFKARSPSNARWRPQPSSNPAQSSLSLFRSFSYVCFPLVLSLSWPFLFFGQQTLALSANNGWDSTLRVAFLRVHTPYDSMVVELSS